MGGGLQCKLVASTSLFNILYIISFRFIWFILDCIELKIDGVKALPNGLLTGVRKMAKRSITPWTPKSSQELHLDDAQHLWNAAKRGMPWGLVHFSEEYRKTCPDPVEFNSYIFLEQI